MIFSLTGLRRLARRLCVICNPTLQKFDPVAAERANALSAEPAVEV